MHRGTIAVLLPLVLGLFLGIFLGYVFRPENYQLWIHLWSGKMYQGGQYVTVPAPIGQPAMFYIQGSTWGEKLSQRLTKQGLKP